MAERIGRIQIDPDHPHCAECRAHDGTLIAKIVFHTQYLDDGRLRWANVDVIGRGENMEQQAIVFAQTDSALKPVGEANEDRVQVTGTGRLLVALDMKVKP